MAYHMNPQRGAHMDGKQAGDVDQHSGQHHMPHLHIHTHSGGHTVHIMHHDGRHEVHEHEHGDADGMAAHVHQHFGQDHGYSGGESEEDEMGAGPGV